MSKNSSFLAKLFHHEEHEGHEVLIITNCTIFLRDLRVLRGENWVAAGRAVSLQCNFKKLFIFSKIIAAKERKERIDKSLECLFSL
jgi:hypothetical protein